MPTRRAFLAAALAAGAGTLVPRAAFADPGDAVAGDGVPETLTVELESALGRQASELPIGHLRLCWSGPECEGGRIRFRSSTGWTDWEPVRPSDEGDSGQHRALVAGDGASGYELQPPPGAYDVTALVINTTDGPVTTTATGPVPF